MMDFSKIDLTGKPNKEIEGVVNYLMGKVMKETKGKADPQRTRDMLYQALFIKCASDDEYKQLIEEVSHKRIENGKMVEYTGDHRLCDCEMGKNASQDISWDSKCVFCNKDLSEAKSGFAGKDA